MESSGSVTVSRSFRNSVILLIGQKNAGSFLFFKKVGWFALVF